MDGGRGRCTAPPRVRAPPAESPYCRSFRRAFPRTKAARQESGASAATGGRRSPSRRASARACSFRFQSSSASALRSASSSARRPSVRRRQGFQAGPAFLGLRGECVAGPALEEDPSGLGRATGFPGKDSPGHQQRARCGVAPGEVAWRGQDEKRTQRLDGLLPLPRGGQQPGDGDARLGPEDRLPRDAPPGLDGLVRVPLRLGGGGREGLDPVGDGGKQDGEPGEVPRRSLRVSRRERAPRPQEPELRGAAPARRGANVRLADHGGGGGGEQQGDGGGRIIRTESGGRPPAGQARDRGAVLA